ncbi:hypothetical protein, partial [Nocardia sp. NPDC004260]
ESLRMSTLRSSPTPQTYTNTTHTSNIQFQVNSSNRSHQPRRSPGTVAPHQRQARTAVCTREGWSEVDAPLIAGVCRRHGRARTTKPTRCRSALATLNSTGIRSVHSDETASHPVA